MFFLSTLGQYCCDKNSIDLQVKIGTAVFDLLLVSAITTLAALVLAHLAGQINLPGLSTISTQTPYILFGVAAAVVLLDMITFALQQCKKKAIPQVETQNKDQEDQSEIILQLTKQQEELDTLKKKLEEKDRALQEREKLLVKKESRFKTQTFTKLIIHPSTQKDNLVSEIVFPPPQNTDSNELIVVQEEITEIRLDLDKKKIYISPQHASMIEKDAYILYVCKGRFKETKEEYLEEFFDNLNVFLEPTIYNLCTIDNKKGGKYLKTSVKKIVSGTYLGFFEEVGITKDRVFAKKNPEDLASGFSRLINNLLYAHRMDNKVLIHFWIQSIKDFVPLGEYIDQFESIIKEAAPITDLHELFFACLIENHEKPEVAEFIKNNPNSLKIRNLNLEDFGPLMGLNLRINKDKIDQFFTVLDLSEMECLKLSFTEKSADHNLREIQYILEKCTFNYVQIRHLKEKENLSKSLVICKMLKKDSIQFFDFVDSTFDFRTHFWDNVRHHFPNYHWEDGTRKGFCQIAYLFQKRVELDKYLSNEYGVEPRAT